jgi:hypothetical protein
MSKAMRHEDDRRILFDWATGDFKSAKAVIVKKSIAIGDHYHKNKEEEFLLLQGMFIELIIGQEKQYNIPGPYKVNIPRGVYHKFVCSEGSILLGVATELFDVNDEIKL